MHKALDDLGSTDAVLLLVRLHGRVTSDGRYFAECRGEHLIAGGYWGWRGVVSALLHDILFVVDFTPGICEDLLVEMLGVLGSVEVFQVT